jgi:hypothetical protein
MTNPEILAYINPKGTEYPKPVPKPEPKKKPVKKGNK